MIKLQVEDSSVPNCAHCRGEFCEALQRLLFSTGSIIDFDDARIRSEDNSLNERSNLEFIHFCISRERTVLL